MMTHATTIRDSGRRARRRAAFTLVELLVVITIIGILISLLLPAVQSAREAARQAQCKNHLKQISLAAIAHSQTHGHFPTGGWAWRWVGDPDKGFSKDQPGGWHYNVLPFLEQGNLHSAGAGQAEAAKKTAAAQRLRTPLSMFHCPSRRGVQLYSHTICTRTGRCYLNSNDPGNMVARSDYAACGGDMVGNHHADGAGMDAYTDAQWATVADGPGAATGVIHRRSEVQLAHLRDGASNTYLVGERYLNPDRYSDGEEGGNDQAWDQGYDYDTFRWTYNAATHAPRRDRAGVSNEKAFGSAHAAGFHMAFCDGSVRTISYGISSLAHARLGNRKDGQAIDFSQF